MTRRQTSIPMARRPAREPRELKLRQPVLRADTVPRTALVNRLRASTAPLATVLAPAGYGKTTLLAQWAARDGRPVAWLTLDHADDDPAALERNVARALASLPLGRLPTAGGSAAARLGAALLSAARPVALVLDDVHVLRSRGSLALLAMLAEHVPDGSTLVLAGRGLRLGIARARAAGRLFELRTEELALTQREEHLLLRAAGVELAQPGRGALRQRMEGWAAGTFLAALTVDDGATGPAGGEERFVADYFDFECLAGLTPGDLGFLTTTSVLDRLSGPLCDAVLEADDSGARLDALARANLFLVPLDRERRWYRYHRAFREYLHAELVRREPRRLPGLNRRAAAWCESHGDACAALTYARAAGDVDHVSRLVVQGGLTPPPSDPAASGERGWLAWFDDPELLRRYPGVAARGAWVHLLDANAAAAARWQDALGSAAARGRRTPAGDTPAALAAVLRAAPCNDGAEQMRADARRAARGLDPAGPWPPVALLLRGVAELHLGDVDHAERSLADAAEAAESRALGEIRTLALTELSLVAAAQGDDARAEELVVEARSAAASAGLDDDPRSALAAAVSARLHLRQGETGLARAALERADALSVRLTHVLPWYAMQTCLELGRAELAFVDAEGARALLDRAAAIARRRPGLGRLEAELETLQGEVNALAAHAGRPAGLTAAELRLLPLLTTHLSFREIAEQLYVSRNTVKTQAISVYRKLDASSRSEAIARARELGLVDAASPRAEFTLSG